MINTELATLKFITIKTINSGLASFGCFKFTETHTLEIKVKYRGAED